jgi:hypothetical protein
LARRRDAQEECLIDRSGIEPAVQRRIVAARELKLCRRLAVQLRLPDRKQVL